MTSSTDAALGALFDTLDQSLLQHRPFWQLQAFHQPENPWPQHPDLWQTLQQFTPEVLAADARQGCARPALLYPWIENAVSLHQKCRITRLSSPAQQLPAPLSYAIPGRKLQQLLAFQPLVPERRHVIEWCAGQGHLGRVLAAAGALSVTSLERDATLCERGSALARRAGVDMQFHQTDVLDPAVASYLRADRHAVALHACGDLHTMLLKLGMTQAVSGLTLAPCCYHLTRAPLYRALSARGQSSALKLSRADLRLAVKQTTTAGTADRRRAQIEVSWRLGFDCLQRELRGIDEYLPLPAIPKPLLKSDFSTFARWASDRKALTLPTSIDLEHFERLGADRYTDIRRIEWVQQLFQRPLELWLLLDRALFLQDHGYRVRVGTFCAEQVTPRNLVICAEAP